AATASYSASICVDVPNGIDVLLPTLTSLLRSSRAWRRPLFGAWGEGRAQAAARLTALLAELPRTLAPLTAEGLLDAAAGLPPEEAPLRPDTRLQRVPVCRLRDDGRTLVVTTRGVEGEVRILSSPSLRPVSGWLARQKRAFTWGALLAAHPRANAGEMEALVRSLLACEALKRLPWPATSDEPR
ncbi:MAG: hypothetical protein ACK4N5_02160, partial [Myxococcales bacterium]